MIDDEEVTDVRPILDLDDETTGLDEVTAPGVDAPLLQDELTMDVTPVDRNHPLKGSFRLPRTQVAELDQAIQDFEALLLRLDRQSVRLLLVSCLSFISLFVPWHVVTTPGFQQVVPGIETGGIMLMLLLVAQIALIGFERHLRQRFLGLVTWLRQSLGALVILTMTVAIFAPSVPKELSYQPSLWVAFPAIALCAQVLGFFRILPSLRRPAVARSGHKE
ncbi:MAG: hypothetical protein VX405_09800 [Myxococcota bacterium]|nr:hypothetical protein [Myxococcota bacterium]